MVDYSLDIFFWFEVVPFLLHIHFTYEFQQLDTKYCVQIRNVALAQAKTIVVNKCKVLKIGLSSVCFEKFGQGAFFELDK